LTSRAHIKPWGVTVTTPQTEHRAATVQVRTEIDNPDMADILVRTTLADPRGREVASIRTDLVVEDQPRSWKNREPVLDHELSVPDPQRWSLEEPVLYVARSEILTRDGVVLDRVDTRFGIREIRFDADGFRLNGQPVEFRGVCMHHDLGALGAAVSRAAQARQIRILQDMGCNAIRTSHNPPDPGYLDLCDEMGMLVLDEAFDEWRVGKVENGYHVHFDRWSERDLRDFVRRDRNHPSVVMWSIGNEIGDQTLGAGRLTARRLVGICHEEDPTRPVTAGLNAPQDATVNKVVDELDVFGVNYQPAHYERFRESYPDKPLFGSETASCVSTRGFYDFPERPMEKTYIHRDSLQVASFDLETPPWAKVPDVEFDGVDRCPYVMGEFVWTGFDYLGEPTPYNAEWPARSSYFGIVDLCGIPKDRYYLYQARWSGKRVLHLVPHWTWPGREGQKTRVQCYTSYDRIELFVNGASQGVREKDPAELMERYRLSWTDVVYQPGELKAVALSEDGEPLAEAVVRTAGAPHKLVLLPERTEIAADGNDLVYVRVRMHDAAGTLCPWAEDLVTFGIEGPADLAAVDNGSQTSLEPFRGNQRRLFYGQAMAVLRSRKGETGTVLLRAATPSVRGVASCEIRAGDRSEGIR
jgi:beta-galactosidase